MILLKAFGIALAILAISMGSSGAVRAAAPQAGADHPWIEQFVLKTLLAGLSLVAIRVVNRTSFAAAGFARSPKIRWFPVWAPALALGAFSSLAILLAGSRGLGGVFGSYGFLGIVFWVWFYSSVTEEIFTRGWFQSYLAERQPAQAVLSSALLFGAMHLTLFRRIDPIAASAIVLSAAALGWIAAGLRERYGSLLPAIAAHVSFNVGGMAGGILYTIGYRLSTGHLPVQ